MRLILVPSPFVGPATWKPTAAWLRAMGHEPVVVPTGAPRHPDDVVDRVVMTADIGAAVLVTHSNAGLYAPRLSSLLEVSATVYVDAALAGTDRTTAMAPPDLQQHLRKLADDDGLLPPWTEWWDDVGDLFPDDAARLAVERSQPRVPVSYFDARLSVPAGWESRPQAYLAFGDTYAEEIAFAREHRWPVTVVDGGHLHQLHDPVGVGTEIIRLARMLH